MILGLLSGVRFSDKQALPKNSPIAGEHYPLGDISKEKTAWASGKREDRIFDPSESLIFPPERNVRPGPQVGRAGYP